MAEIDLADILESGVYVKVTDSGDGISFETSTDVVKTDDSRLSDAREPEAHASTHATGGTDAIAPSDIGAASTDTFSTSADGLVPKPSAESGNYLKDDGTWDSPAASSLAAGSTIEQPKLTGLRTDAVNITTDIADGAYTLDTDYDDYYGVLVDNTVITVPDPSGGHWSPILELAQDSTGGRAVTFEDSGGNTILPMVGTMSPLTEASSVTVYTLYYSNTLSKWRVARINQFAPPAAPVSATVYDIDSQTESAAPANVTSQWRAETLTIAKDGTYSAGDARQMYVNAAYTDNEFHAFSIDDVGTVADLEVLALVRSDSTTSSYNSTVFVRGSNTTNNSGNAYGASLVGSKFRLIRVHSNTTSTLVDATLAWAVDTEYWIRLKVSGTSLSAKVWAYGATEPSTWTLTSTDSNLDTGWAGFGGYQKNGPHRLCYFAWSTDGSTVALPS